MITVSASAKRNLITILILISSAPLLFSQEKTFEIAVLPDASDMRDYNFAADPRSGNIVLVWRTGFWEPKPRAIQSVMIRNAGGEPSITKVYTLSQEDLNAERPHIVYHADLKRYLVTWEETDHQGIKTQGQDIGGRFLSASGKPKGGPLNIISYSDSERAGQAIPWLKSDPVAPKGAAFYLIWLEHNAAKIEGQWLTKTGKTLGNVELIKMLDRRPDEVGDLVRVGPGQAVLNLTLTNEETFVGSTLVISPEIQFIRLSPASGKQASVTSHKSTSDYEQPKLLALSGKNLIACALADIDRENPDKSKVLAFAVKNKKKLKPSRAEYNLNEDLALPIEHTLVQLDNGDIYSVVFHLDSTLSVQQINDKGNAEGELISIPGIFPYTAAFGAVGIPGEYAILIALADLSQDRTNFAIKGIVVRP